MGKKKLTFKFVKKYFEDRDCELFETEYINNYTKMRYRCSCGNSDKICFDSFKKRRTKCVKHSNNTKKLTFDYVKQYFEDHDCELLETEYINAHTKMKYRCKCGNSKCKTTFANFKQGRRCMECGSKKHTYKYVYNYFKKYNCLLLETEYINALTPMKYRCNCGNSKCKITFNKFQRGGRCAKCYGNEKYTFEFVYNYFKERDCELLETEYINNRTKMKYRCKCGNTKCKISFDSFKKGSRCMECSGIKKHTLEDVKKYFKDHNCELFETEYINNSTKMRYRCICGNTDCKISFKDFKTGRRCIKCSGNEKHTFKFVQKYFEDHNCKLLSKEYINARTPMKYECDCGNSDCKISFNSFSNGRRCMKCAVERMSGENNCNYNPNLTDEERNGSRPGCKKWRKKILEKDNYTSQCCFQVGRKLIVHHIEDYSRNKELRTVLSNGFLFCEKHHIEFHKKYGYNCNRKQLEEFLERYQKDIIISIINGVIKKKA